MLIHLVAALPVLIWIYLLTARGGFWRIARHLPPGPPDQASAHRVIAVIPARNEAEVIGEAVASLLRQRLGGSLHVIVIDDGSTDGTASAALRAAAEAGASSRVTVIAGAPLAAGWTGKLWALSQGVEAALALQPDFLLFTDADIHHEPENVAALVTNAETYGRDLVSYMVRLSTASIAEAALIPAFVFFFFKLYPPAWIESVRYRTAGAAGGCILIRPRMLARIGGLRAIRAEIIDDCALARAVKQAGGHLWLGLTRTARSLRPYGSVAEIGHMISRTAFNQLHHSYMLLALTLTGLFLTYLLPPLLMLTGDRVLLACGAAAWGLMSLGYLPMVRFYGQSVLWAPCLPAVALFYAAATVHSAVQYALGRGGNWKGRVQDGLGV